MRYATECVQPAYEYFKAKFDDASGELKDTVLAFRAARYFVPAMVNELQPTTSDIDSLKLFPFFDANLIDKLKDELPTYLAAAEDDRQVLKCYHGGKITRTKCPFQLILLVQPSSAAAGRVFSLLQNSFRHQQRSSLEDYISVSVMLQYNRT